MKLRTISDIYAANAAALESLNTAVADFPEDEIDYLPAGEAWSIRDVVEHLAIVDEGIAQICAKLIAKAKAAGSSAPGQLAITAGFLDRAADLERKKLVAPDIVRPRGSLSIADALMKLRENKDRFGSMQNDFETVDLRGPTFPHPYLGPLSATEWLVLAGAHQTRHTKQIKRIVIGIRDEKKPRSEGG